MAEVDIERSRLLAALIAIPVLVALIWLSEQAEARGIRVPVLGRLSDRITGLVLDGGWRPPVTLAVVTVVLLATGPAFWVVLVVYAATVALLAVVVRNRP